MRFCPWYPLAQAAAHAPAGPNVLQVRRARGLIAYPKGQSAMVHYRFAEDAAAAAAECARQLAPEGGEELLCRHLIAEDEAGDRSGLPSADRLAAYYDKLLAEFLHRFGAVPSSPSPPTNPPTNAP